MNGIKKYMACLVVASLCFLPACPSWIKKPVTVVCENQETALHVKTQAKVIMHNAKLTIDTLTALLDESTNAVVVVALTGAISIATVVMEAAYHLVYEVACPELEALGVLEVQAEAMTAVTTKAMKMARAEKSK